MVIRQVPRPVRLSWSRATVISVCTGLAAVPVLVGVEPPVDGDRTVLAAGVAGERRPVQRHAGVGPRVDDDLARKDLARDMISELRGIDARLKAK